MQIQRKFLIAGKQRMTKARLTLFILVANWHQFNLSFWLRHVFSVLYNANHQMPIKSLLSTQDEYLVVVAYSLVLKAKKCDIKFGYPSKPAACYGQTTYHTIPSEDFSQSGMQYVYISWLLYFQLYFFTLSLFMSVKLIKFNYLLCNNFGNTF